ncbi:MAG: diaminobutyrate acetyltransferase [Acidobacteriota bacterium]|nr:diaminobutyrate acetyltransferase [Acidobacteriota bacterium]
MRFRHPQMEDGSDLWRLVGDAGTLELNSAYTYVLMATHFADTCLLAESDEGEPLGFVVAYRPPTHPEAVFVWQVAVAPEARGQGLGRRLLEELVARTAEDGVRYLEATVTPDNEPSRKLFRSFARELDTECRVEDFMGQEVFPQDHEAEDLFRIGPIEGSAFEALAS